MQESAEDLGAARGELMRRAAIQELLNGKTLAERIVFLRREQKLTQPALAAELKRRGLRVGTRTVAGWEAGRRPQHHQRTRLAEVLGVDENALFND